MERGSRRSRFGQAPASNRNRSSRSYSPEPPATPNHGRKQFRIAALLGRELPEGTVIIGCPISTSDGVAATDVAWLDHDRAEEAGSALPLINAPEICVEIVSPSDTAGVINEKRELYVGAGAEEVWICELIGDIRFYSKESPGPQEHSHLCPSFPTQLR
jgi:Uma2 family endonuclease